MNKTFFMPLIQSEWAAAGAPRGNVVRVNVQLTVARRQGRELVASCLAPVASRQSQSQNQSQGQSPSVSRQSQNQSTNASCPLPTASHQGPSQSRSTDRQPPVVGRRPPAASRRERARCHGQFAQRTQSPRQAAETRASYCFAEDEQNRVVERFHVRKGIGRSNLA